jgi:hypothetical protein
MRATEAWIGERKVFSGITEQPYVIDPDPATSEKD